MRDGRLGVFYVDGVQVGEGTTHHQIQYRHVLYCIAYDCAAVDKKHVDGMVDVYVLYNRSLSSSDVRSAFLKPTREVHPAANDTGLSNFIYNLRRDLASKVLRRAPLDHLLDHTRFDADDLILEFGVFKGNTITKIATRNPHVHSIFGFDSFQGLPEYWRYPYVAGTFNMSGSLPIVPSNVVLISGWFSESLPQFKVSLLRNRTDVTRKRQIALLHVDCDLYSSTKTVLELLEEYIGPGTVILFDELLNFDGFEEHEVKAFYEFVMRTGVRYEAVGIECIGFCESVAIRILPQTLKSVPFVDSAGDDL